MIDTATYLSATQIADILSISCRGIQRRANKEGWHFHEIAGLGGKRREYLLAGLPQDLQISYNKEIASIVPVSSAHSSQLTAHEPEILSPDLTDQQNRIASARADLVREYISVKDRAKKSKLLKVGPVTRDFVAAYNTGASYPEIYAVLGQTSKQTLDRWATQLRNNAFDFSVLAPGWGQHRKGKTKVSADELAALLKFALNPNRSAISDVISWTKTDLARRKILSPSSEATLRRKLLVWKEANYDRWIFYRQGEKALDDKVLPYLERDASILDVGQVLVADGHVLNFHILHPFTGKATRMMLVMFYDWASRYPAGWEIMATENIQNIHSALRRAVLALGKIPKIVLLDNGKAFKSKIFTSKKIDLEQSGIYGMYAKLGIETYFAWPYNAKSKPVERFFGTFNKFERLLPCYTGASIKDKPAYLSRNEKLHKKMHNPFVPTIAQAHQMIRAWVIEEYSQRPHRGLKGLKPADVWEAGKGPGVDEQALRYLMMSETEKPVRRNGISFIGGINYYDEALYGYHGKVRIKYDMQDLEQIYVYSPDGTQFMCTAKPMQKLNPIARFSDNPMDMEAVKEQIKRKRRLAKQTEIAAREIPAFHELPGCTFDPVTLIPEQKKIESTITRAEAEHIEAEAAKVKVVPIHEEKEVLIYNTDVYENLLRRECAGEELSIDDLAAMRAFEQRPEYKMLEEYYQQVAEGAVLSESYNRQ